MVDFGNLPREVTDVILSHLPLQEAVRTSILSKNWRYEWTTVRDLFFELDHCEDWCSDRTPCEVNRVAVNKLVSSINHVLSSHANPIWLFHAIGVPPISDIDRWLLHLSRSSVRDLRIVVKQCKDYVLPPSLYSFERLTSLQLHGFSMTEVPLSFRGFLSLKYLGLSSSTLTDDAFERLVSHCPLLEELSMTICHGIHCLKINAPNLQLVGVYGVDFEDIGFEGIHAKLSVVRVCSPRFKHDMTIVPTYLDQFFVNLPGIEELKIDVNLLKNSLAASFPPMLLPAPFFCLHDLSIRIRLDDYREFCAALYLFRSSPNLRTLQILEHLNPSTTFRDTSRWLDETITSNCTFWELLHVGVNCNLEREEDLEFIKFVLLNSPFLEELHIQSQIFEHTHAHQIRRLDRASPSARVLYKVV